MEDLNITERRKRAKKRVNELKGFYIHLMVYLIVNIFLIAVIIMAQSDQEEFTLHWYNFSTAIFWGLGLMIHALVTFRLNPFFGKSWEDRMIQKYMEEDSERAKRLGSYSESVKNPNSIQE